MIFQVLSVVLNMVLAPFLIFGIGPWPKLGVTGAALATFVSILVADLLIIVYFEKKYHYLRFRFPLWRAQMKIWGAMLRIGVPAGAEFVLLFVYILIVYVIIRNFGPAAQAGFGVGARVMQALFLPVVALSFAVSPVVGQNFGGRQPDRVRDSVKSGLGIAAAMMLVLALITWLAPGTMIRFFSKDAAVMSPPGLCLPARACFRDSVTPYRHYSARPRAWFFLRCRPCCSRARRGSTSNLFGTSQSDRRCSRPA